MPVQQSNDMFGLSLGDEFGFNHEGLSVSDLGTGFGNVQAADVSGNLSFPTTHAPFSLADELAGALSGGVNHEDDATTLLAELDLDSGHHERLPSLQSSPMRTAKSSRMTVTSQRTDNETDEFTSNIDFENVTDTLQVMVHDLRQITETLRTCNIPSTSTSHDTEQRIESLCSTLIKGIYE